jgi:hypothetical protein
MDLTDEACEVGSDTGSPASPYYGGGAGFTGWIEWGQQPTVQDRNGPTVKARQLTIPEVAIRPSGLH